MEQLEQRRAENFGDGPSFRGFRRNKSGGSEDVSGRGGSDKDVPNTEPKEVVDDEPKEEIVEP